MDDSYIFCNYEAIFPCHFSIIFNAPANIQLDAVYQCSQISCLDFRAHHQQYKETSNKLQQRIHRVHRNQNTKDALLMTVPSLTPACTCETIAKMEWTVLPHPAHSPDLARSNYHLFDPIQHALCGYHFADDNELKQSFCDVLQNQGRKFYNTGTQCLTQ
jgi:hypothetical protein